MSNLDIEIIAIGNEVLSGYTTNTNAAFISQELHKEGWRVNRHTALPDDPQRLQNGINEALQRNRLIITTGGLGPTCDDISRQIVAEMFHSDFHYDEAIGADLIKRYGQMPTVIEQAMIPNKATPLHNTSGTAPGLIFNENGVTLIMLPGVPAEMKTMWHKDVIPYIRKHFSSGNKYFCKRVNLFGIPEPVADKILRELSTKHPEIEYGIYTSQGSLSIHLTAFTDSDAAADALINPALNVIKTQFASSLFEAPSGKIEEAIHHQFIQQGITLSAAESCSGGSLAARLTAFPGASQYFLGSIVAYSNELKTTLLGVPETLIQEKGAVSEEVVLAMLEGLIRTHKKRLWSRHYRDRRPNRRHSGKAHRNSLVCRRSKRAISSFMAIKNAWQP